MIGFVSPPPRPPPERPVYRFAYPTIRTLLIIFLSNIISYVFGGEDIAKFFIIIKYDRAATVLYSRVYDIRIKYYIVKPESIFK